MKWKKKNSLEANYTLRWNTVACNIKQDSKTLNHVYIILLSVCVCECVFLSIILLWAYIISTSTASIESTDCLRGEKWVDGEQG